MRFSNGSQNQICDFPFFDMKYEISSQISVLNLRFCKFHEFRIEFEIFQKRTAKNGSYDEIFGVHFRNLDLPTKT